MCLLGLCVNAPAAVLTQTQTKTLIGTGDVLTYSFNQFDVSFGTLNSITFTIVSSIDSGSFSVLNNTNTAIRVKSPRDVLTVVDNHGSGADYDSGNLPLLTTPSTAGLNGYSLSGNQGTNFTVTPKSLIGASAVITDLSAYLITYTGTGSVTFDANIAPAVTITGGSATFDMSGVTNSTVLSLVYDYTAPPVPEPSTYALFGMGALALLFVVRRRKA